MASRLRDQATEMTASAAAAAEMSGEASCGVGRDGTVSVTATAGGRVREVSIDQGAMGELLPELESAAVRAVSQAIAAARERAARSAPEAVAQPDPAAERLARDLASDRVSASSADGQVTVTATGAGEIQSVRIEKEHGHGEDSHTLGANIAAACNGALEAAGRLQQRLLDPLRRDAEERSADIGGVVRQHTRQMDELMDRLSGVERRIGDC
jgi:DNA-binding protein YbaB